MECTVFIISTNNLFAFIENFERWHAPATNLITACLRYFQECSPANSKIINRHPWIRRTRFPVKIDVIINAGKQRLTFQFVVGIIFAECTLFSVFSFQINRWNRNKFRNAIGQFTSLCINYLSLRSYFIFDSLQDSYRMRRNTVVISPQRFNFVGIRTNHRDA